MTNDAAPKKKKSTSQFLLYPGGNCGMFRAGRSVYGNVSAQHPYAFGAGKNNQYCGRFLAAVGQNRPNWIGQIANT